MSGPATVAPGVFQIGGSSITHFQDGAVYLVDAGDDRWVMVDSGAGRSALAIEENIHAVGASPANVAYLILTHAHIDHVGGAATLKSRLGCKVVAHELDAPAVEDARSPRVAADIYGVDYSPVRVDIKISGRGQTLRCGHLEFELLHTPGHTPGSMSPIVDVEGLSVLFGQDIHGPFDRAWGSDISQWRASMEALMRRGCDVLCEGHFGVFRGKAAVKNYIQGYLDRYRA